MQGYCVSGTIHPWDQGSQNIGMGRHRFGTSRHPTLFFTVPLVFYFILYLPLVELLEQVGCLYHWLSVVYLYTRLGCMADPKNKLVVHQFGCVVCLQSSPNLDL